MSQATVTLRGRNPDVLTCIANLSNDEVFTPPEFANQMLDLIASAWADSHGDARLWADPTVRFLDPFTKSGVFLREITARLTVGLAGEIPDLRKRVEHILTTQVFGIGITELTALLARRSLYCSKRANGPHSVAKSFATEDGNIWFERTEHTWAGARCAYCGAGKSEYERGAGLESHAYAFIHATDIKARIAQIFGVDMHFDVIIGNPPYQMSDGGGSGSSAMPIYQKFVEQAQRLDPRYLSMVIPSRWFSGGKGLDAFRSNMLADRHVRHISDYPDSRLAFAGVDVAGGISYFLWDRDNEGDCTVETVTTDQRLVAQRRLDEFDTFVRDNRAISVIHKVLAGRSASFSEIVSSRRPFGIDSAHKSDPQGDLYLFASGTDGKVRRQDVPAGLGLIDTWKVLLSKTASEHAGQSDKAGRKRVLSRIAIMPPGSVATESYLVVGPVASKDQAENVANFLRTRFVRFLIQTILLTQNITKGMFEFVPKEDFSRAWSDGDLFEKYNLTVGEIEYIESVIKPMEPADE